VLHSEREWEALYRAVLKASGLDLSQYKANQLQRRIGMMAESKGYSDLADLAAWITGKPENLSWFMDKLAINVSELFRNPEKWEELRTKVIPGLLRPGKGLRCWSAGCSYGAEATTLGMLLDRHFPGPHRILGTDIDDAALAQAKRGEFSESDVRGVPKEYRDAYLVSDGHGWKSLPAARKHLEFRKQNLLADKFDSDFDLILCRNVVIYFTEEAKSALYRKFFDALRPGGVLFVGGTERIFSATEIGFESRIPLFYQRPDNGERQWRNAS